MESSVVGLATVAVKAALERSGVSGGAVGHVVMGNVVPTETNDAYLSHVAAIDAGLPVETPAFNVNRLCGSGLQAIVSVAQAIALGDCDFAVGGGAESMSRGPYIASAVHWGARLRDCMLIDYTNGILLDPWQKIHMGITAESVAVPLRHRPSVSDALALESQRRAARAIADGRFKDQIVSINGPSRKEEVSSTPTNMPRRRDRRGLAAMKPVCQKDGGVTAGHASGLNDGAAAVVLADAKQAEAAGLKPMARLVGYAHAGVDPAYMGIGPVPANPQGAGANRHQGSGPRCRRIERGLRRSGLRRHPRVGYRPGQG
jgi:acetyl-CoA C-acetyltransferase